MKTSSSYVDVINAAGITGTAAIWSANWQDSEASFLPDNVYFLQQGWIEESLAKLNMAPAVKDAFRKTRPFFAQNQALQRLSWHCQHLLYQNPSDPVTLRNWPPLQPSLGPDGAMFYAFICLAGLPHIEELHRRRGIDPAITYDTVSDIALWIEHYHKQFKEWGLSNVYLGWIYGYLSDKLVKLGRLQYSCPSKFSYDFHVYRHRTDKRVIMLAGDGMRFRPDGQLEGANNIMAGDRCWTSRWMASATEVKGHPVNSNGQAQRATVLLSAREWEEVLALGRPVRAVHIPATGPLTHEACQASLHRACVFLPAHYPEDPFCAFTCVSWLMDNQFDQYLPETSNILKFQRDFHLYPVTGASDQQTYERVFGRSYENIDEAPRETSLQRIVVAHVKNGGRWHNGGGFILRDDEKPAQ